MIKTIVYLNLKLSWATITIQNSTPPKYTFTKKTTMIHINVNLVAWEIVCYKPQHDIFTSSHAVVVSSGFKKEHESQLT